MTDPRFGGSPERALLALLDGRYDAARDGWRAAVMSLDSAVANRASAARAALWARDATGAGEELAAIEATGLHAPIIDLHRQVIQAGIAAVDGRTDDALARYGDALRGWADLGITFEEAMTGLDMATLLDPTIPRVRAATERARAIFTGLRATRLLELLDAATGRATSPEASSTGAPSHGDRASFSAERAVRRSS